MSWDPGLYLRFAALRARPFRDLVDHIEVDEPELVVDLGCGPGNMTVSLCERWPRAMVHGIDSSADMLAQAATLAGPRLAFTLGSIESWRPDGPVDVIVSNAALQWVPDHPRLLATWLSALRPGGALAFQVPLNVDGRAAQIFRGVATSPRWADRLAGVASSDSPSAAGGVARPAEEYVHALGRLGARVDAWETTYQHLMPGEDGVLEWYRGTGLRPYLDALDEDAAAEFRAEVASALREAFPAHPYGALLPFRRVFVIAYPDAVPSA